LVSLIEDDAGAYTLDVKLHAHLPGIDAGQAMRIMEAAHQTCPYSKMMRGEANVSLFVD
jgi:organic hydroperoxide reductase OsmC/OhrA